MTNQPFSLVCLPFAGSGASFYRAWPPAPFDGPGRVLAVQFPGREELFGEKPFDDVQSAGAALVPDVLDEADPSTPLVLFGHSLGALVAYEMARAIERSHPGRLSHLYVSGSPGPQGGRVERATGLDDEEFLARVYEFAGYRHEAFDVPELREILLPVLRADVAMHENYQPADGEPLSTPITALRGADDLLVSARQAREWADWTQGTFSYQELPGSHMYLAESPDPLLRVLSGTRL
ncbi:thioesterase II family protein [Streptomyces sp. ISL-94]|uniref:thioesterase II family protein n=1 Tax=Streptomyces sp. ISL-94 TaxID=2819190 RepID=UPI001BE7E8FF|nr:alpha/beta fold hydrolase [Streptomyces sp. ISL-94]MBT2481660.1 thioesterase [Streptomyces sp. ISL-94]